MDHMMPGIDGVETMQILRDIGYTNPVIALTATAMIGMAEEFMNYGFDDFISKPIQTKRLNRILMTHIKPQSEDTTPDEITYEDITVVAPVTDINIHNPTDEGLEEVIPFRHDHVHDLTWGGPAFMGETTLMGENISIDENVSLSSVGIAANGKYFKAPIRPTDMDKFLEGDGLRNDLRGDFMRNHSDSVSKIRKALENDDVKTAHITAHSLKGVAGLIGEKDLAISAQKLEYLFAAEHAGDIPAVMDALDSLEMELAHAISHIQDILPEKAIAEDYDNSDENKAQAAALYKKLYPLLESRRVDCLNYVDDLRAIPDAEQLAQQIEDFDFHIALETLKSLQRSL